MEVVHPDFSIWPRETSFVVHALQLRDVPVCLIWQQKPLDGTSVVPQLGGTDPCDVAIV